jgi:hypothetical protein
MPVARESLLSVEEERRRAPTPAPEVPLRRRELSAVEVLALQRSGGNRAAAALIARMKERPDIEGGDFVEFDENEPLPHRMRGTLESAPDHKFQLHVKHGDRVYARTLKGTGPKIVIRDPLEVARENKVKDLKKAKSTLFNAAQGGAAEGSFEYVANYLFGEVFGTDPEAAQKMWDEVWEVRDVQGEEPAAVGRDGLDQTKLLKRMIDLGLDASWKRLPVRELVKVSVDGKLPGSSMPVVTHDAWDYFSSLYNWAPWPETSGVGFHTTDGDPGAVAKPKATGGWGGITRPVTVDFFKQRYALGQGWNPLGPWMEQHGPTFRKGIKDNELLSTVSVATAIHGSVRFPLADTPGRKGTHHTANPNQQDSFKMEVYIYAVRVGSGFATFEAQGKNAFGEIATGDIAIEDIIGWSKITRWHPYSPETGLPLTVGFDYTMSPLTRNPEFKTSSLNEKLYAAALGEINRENSLTGKPYEG